MRLFDLKEDRQLDELLPALGAVGSAVGGAAKAVGGALAKGASAIGGAAKTAATGLAAPGQMDPAQAAQAAKERQDQKKQIQDAIKAKQQELADLQKQLTQLG